MRRILNVSFLRLAAAAVAGQVGLGVGASLGAQESDPRPNECWGFAFGAWTPPLDWGKAGHSTYAPPSPESASAGGAPRHDAATHETSRGPVLVLYPTWWPVGVGVHLDRGAAGDTVPGIAYAFVADGRQEPPESRILAWRKPCNEPPAHSTTRAVPDERRAPPAAPATVPRPRRQASRPR